MSIQHDYGSVSSRRCRRIHFRDAGVLLLVADIQAIGKHRSGIGMQGGESHDAGRPDLSGDDANESLHCTQGHAQDSSEAENARLRACLAAIVEGDESAFAAFYDATAAKVYGMALRIMREPELAEDVCVEAFAQAWRQADRYDPGRSRVLGWLLTICRSRAIDALRRREPAESLEGHEQEDLTCDPYDLLHSAEKQSVIHQALRSLEHDQRQLLALAFYRGMTHSELSEYTGIPLGTVKTTLRKSLKQLRDALDAPPSALREGGP